MSTTDVTIPLPDGTGPRWLRAAVALPAGAGPSPGVVVVHELFGLNDDIRGVCERFAANGYAAIAPDLWSVGSRLACLSRMLRELRSGPGGGPVAELLEAARAHLAARAEVDGGRMAVIGFCMGGGFALTFGADAPMAASAVNYGPVPADGERLAAVCPVVASYGGADRGLRGAPARLERHLADYGVPADVHVYPGATHAFMHTGDLPPWMARLPAPMRPSHDPAATEDAWQRILAFFDTHVRRQPHGGAAR
jgi:carboxymethylenebutenolidase